MEAHPNDEGVKAYLRQARQALAAEQFGEATLALSLAFIEAAKLPQAQKISAQIEISSLAQMIERELRLFLERKRRMQAEAERRAQMEKEKRAAAEEFKRRQEKPHPEEKKPEVKIDELKVQAAVAATTGDVALLKISSDKLGSKADAQKISAALKNKPVMQIDAPARLHPASPRRLKLELGAHRHLKAAKIAHRPDKPRIQIGSIS